MRESIREYTGSGHRYEHTLSVERECMVLADRYGFDDEQKNKLAAAALLHDITKKRTFEEQCRLYEHFNIPLEESDINSFKTMHAVTGAAFAAEMFPYDTDEEICNAIRWHTTAKPAMTMMEKLLFLADYIEPDRTFIDCVKLRKLYYDMTENDRSEKALDKIIYIALKMTVTDLLSDDRYIHQDTVSALNYYLLTEDE